MRRANPWEVTPRGITSDALARMIIYPNGRTLDADLSKQLTTELNDPKKRYMWMPAGDYPLAGLFVELSKDGAGAEDFVLLNGTNGLVYEKGATGWREVGQAHEFGAAASQKDVLAMLARGEVSTRDPNWKDLWIGTHHIRVQ